MFKETKYHAYLLEHENTMFLFQYLFRGALAEFLSLYTINAGKPEVHFT
jgi:hypothetical protein